MEVRHTELEEPDKGLVAAGTLRLEESEEAPGELGIRNLVENQT